MNTINWPEPEDDCEIEFEGVDLMTTLEKIGDLIVKREKFLKDSDDDKAAMQEEFKAATDPMQKKIEDFEKNFKQTLEAYNKEIGELLKKHEEESKDEE